MSMMKMNNKDGNNKNCLNKTRPVKKNKVSHFFVTMIVMAAAGTGVTTVRADPSGYNCESAMSCTYGVVVDEVTGSCGCLPTCITFDSYDSTVDGPFLQDFCQSHEDNTPGSGCCLDANGDVSVGELGSDSCGGFEGSKLTMCVEACQGNESCNEVTNNGGGVEISYGVGSCQGEEVCNIVNAGPGSILSYNEDSCRGNWACQGVGRDDHVIEFTAESNACIGRQACFLISNNGDNTKTSIKANACQGDDSCRQIMSTMGEEVDIESRACVGSMACYRMARMNGKNVMIGNNSCRGDNACKEIGFTSSQDVTIGSNSCKADAACLNVGRQAPAAITMGDEACDTSYCIGCKENECGGMNLVFADNGICDKYGATCVSI